MVASGSLWASVKDLVWGIGKRFLLWLPFILLDNGDYWDRYTRPFIFSLTGKDLEMPSELFLGGAVVGVVWSAVWTFHELRRQKLALDEQLSPTVDIDPTPHLQEYPDERGVCRLFYVTVRNVSSTALRDVSVHLTRISPEVNELRWLPVPLHIKHDNGKTHRDKFDLNPQGVRHIDLIVQAPQPRNALLLQHIIAGASKQLPSDQTYVLTIRAEGATIGSPKEVRFVAKLDRRRRLVCLPGAAADTVKGLVEVRHDMKRTMVALANSIVAVSQSTGKVTDVIEKSSRAIDGLVNRPVQRLERFFGIHDAADRLRLRAPTMAREINRRTSDLKYKVSLFQKIATEAISNYVAYGELASMTREEIDALKTTRQQVAVGLRSSTAFRSSVRANEQTRVSTHITLSMKLLGDVIDRQIETTASIIEGFDAVLALSGEED